MGKGIDTPVVFTLNDLKTIYDRDAHGKKGMWAFHNNFHHGHGACATQTNRVCDWVVGILWNNFSAGMDWMTGSSALTDDIIHTTDIEVLKAMSDVVMVFTGDYHPYKRHWYSIQKEFDKEFPESFLREKGIMDEHSLYASLLYSVAIRITMHDIYGIKLDYHASCGRDRWRHVKYVQWLEERFNLHQELLDAVRDEDGNVLSSSRHKIPPQFIKRIKKPLLLPEFETIEDVNKYVKDIPDLKAVHFSKECGWIHVKFQFTDQYWWSEGLKLCKS